MNAKRFWVSVAGSTALLIVAAAAAPLIGSSSIDYGRAWAGLSPDREILLFIRLPRVLLAILAGGTLALTGVLFQALLRDSLAEPYTLGVSSGSALGAVLAICLGWTSIWFAAFIGAGLTLLVVLMIAFRNRRLSAFTLLLAGVSINSIAMASILFLHNVATFSQSFAITRWLMGGLDSPRFPVLAGLAAAVLPFCAFVFIQARHWNLLAVGEEWAAARGVSASRLMIAGYVAGSVMTASITAFTGPIGFIGLIVPHALRLAVGADHRLLVPCSFLAGAAFLVVCDTFARTLLAPVEIPVGVLTAMLGGPFFLFLLRRQSN
jgi:iron complex transport system permease protein